MRRKMTCPAAFLLVLFALAGVAAAVENDAAWIAPIIAKHGEAARPRLLAGIEQVRRAWRPSDGDEAALRAFVADYFEADPSALFGRFESACEALDGHFLEIDRELEKPIQLELGPMLPVDEMLASFSAAAHLDEDLFSSRLAFVVLLNFPIRSLDEKMAGADTWSRRQWAEARLADRFRRRLPAPVKQEIARAFTVADNYISNYNLWMHHVLTEDGQRVFPSGLKLISHWNLRDEIKGQYAVADGLVRQRLIQKAMERIVLQEIPAAAVDNPLVDWMPGSNRVASAPAESRSGETAPSGRSGAAEAARENDRRYEQVIGIFRAQRAADPYSPDLPTFIDRRFGEDRELPEARVRQLFESILTSPSIPRIAKLIEKRLGRKLEPFDIWYAGFKPRSEHSEADLDRLVSGKYPTVAAFQADLPKVLTKLGFAPETAAFVAARIVVEPSRGAGHALGAERRGDSAHLRTRIPAGGMLYKGYNIAVHELGHNVEQVFSLDKIDEFFLKGVPNTAFTEALAFVFQARDLELLGFPAESAEARDLRALNDLWATYEIAGVALVDMGMWRWLYDHPAATAAELREATVRIAREVWNQYYAPNFGVRDVVLLGIYSHMIDAGLYLPDYPLGHLIAFQVEEHFRGKDFGTEFERVCRLGRLTPDAWMKAATGKPLSAEPLLQAGARALTAISK